MNPYFRSPAGALIGCFICTLLGPAIVGFFTFTIFFEALADALASGRGALGFAITVGTLTIAVTAPIAGRIADRDGARKILLFANVALVAVVAAMSVLCATLMGLYVAMALIGILTSCYTVAIPRVITSWFDARRGLAIGIVMSGAGLGSAVLVPVTAYVIESAGWQQAYIVLAAIVLLGSLPAAFMLVYEAPTVVHAPRDGHGAGIEARPRVSGQLMLLSAAFLLIGCGLHGILVHFSPILTDRGIGARAAANYFALASVAMFLGRLVCGFLLDWFPANWVGAVLMLGTSAGILIVAQADEGPLLAAGAILVGLGISAEMDLLSYIVSRIYPIEHFSRFFAFAYSAFVIGISIGPPALGVFYDHFNGYSGGAVVSAAVVIASALTLLAMRRTPISPAKRTLVTES